MIASEEEYWETIKKGKHVLKKHERVNSSNQKPKGRHKVTYMDKENEWKPKITKLSKHNDCVSLGSTLGFVN